MKKGTKQKKTVLKESLGLTNWSKLRSFVENEGAEKLVTEMLNLNGKDFINAYTSLAEFVKPKLQRTTLLGDPSLPLVTTNVDYSKLSPEVLEQIADARVDNED